MTGAAPADAQVLGVLTIDPEGGPVGTVVNGAVDPAVIPDNCSMTTEAFVAEGMAQFDVINGAIDGYIQTTWGGPAGRPDPATDAQSFGALLVGGTLAGALFLPDVSAQAWEQSFVLTFADIATQQPVGALSSFDPATGAGEVTVPNVAPGQWAVAATCLHWNPAVTVDDVAEAVSIATAFVEANLTAPYPGLGDPEFITIAQEVGPSVLGNIFLLPGELWAALFCVHDASGACPGAGPGPGPGPGPDPGPGGPGAPTAPPATAVPGRPTFTG